LVRARFALRTRPSRREPRGLAAAPPGSDRPRRAGSRRPSEILRGVGHPTAGHPPTSGRAADGATRALTRRFCMLRSITTGAAALALSASLAADAQVAEKKSLNLDGARRAIAGAMAEAKRLNAPGGVIAVVDDGGNLMALERIDGTFAAGANISIGKART